MKALFTYITVCLLLVAGVGAQDARPHFDIPEEDSDFAIDYIILDGMEEIDFPEQDDMIVTRAFKVACNGQEGILTYSLFADTGTTAATYRQDSLLWTIRCSLSITGRSPRTLPTPIDLDDGDVEGAFNGDAGTTNFIRNPVSKFAEGYRFMDIESFCKRGQGLVIRTFMANDLAFFGIMRSDGGDALSYPYYTFHDTFRFYD